MRAARLLERAPAVALVGTGAVSVQFGAALATQLFQRVAPAGAVTLRLVLAATVLGGGLAVGRLRGRRAAPGPARFGRPEVGHTGSDWAVVAGFGLVLGAMNLSFYESIARIPLGVAVTVEFSGPLAVALVASRRWVDGLWALLAGAGVVLLASGAGRRLDGAGIGLALLAGAFWAGYILLSQETGRRFDSVRGLSWAMAIASLAVLPFGLAAGGSELAAPPVLGLGLAVAVMSSVIPYSLELTALRRVTARAFGVMMSLDPAVAAAAGFLVLGQHLTTREWLAVGLVMAANAGNSLTGPPVPPGGPPPADDVVATMP